MMPTRMNRNPSEVRKATTGVGTPLILPTFTFPLAGPDEIGIGTSTEEPVGDNIGDWLEMENVVGELVTGMADRLVGVESRFPDIELEIGVGRMLLSEQGVDTLPTDTDGEHDGSVLPVVAENDGLTDDTRGRGIEAGGSSIDDDELEASGFSSTLTNKVSKVTTLAGLDDVLAAFDTDKTCCTPGSNPDKLNITTGGRF